MSKLRQMIPPSIYTFQCEWHPSVQPCMCINLHIDRYAANNVDIRVMHLAYYCFLIESSHKCSQLFGIITDLLWLIPPILGLHIPDRPTLLSKRGIPINLFLFNTHVKLFLSFSCSKSFSVVFKQSFSPIKYLMLIIKWALTVVAAKSL